jgi:hypothetical protein
MFNALGRSSNSSCVLNHNEDLNEPQLITREDWYSPRDYVRPVIGGAVYGLLCGIVFSGPLLLATGFMSALISFGLTAVLVTEMAVVMAASAFIHHQVFVHRLRKYGPQFYSSDIAVDTPAAEAFELCLAATSELPKAKIVGMDEKKGTIMVTLKGNFWITVDRQVTLRVKAADEGKAVISIDPSIKLTPVRRKLIRFIWGDKWYPLIFRSDVNWNRKIIDSVTNYIASVPNWDHRYDPHEMMESAFTEKLNKGPNDDLVRRPDAA